MKTYELLFSLQETSQHALQRVKKKLRSPDYANNLERLFQDTTYTYRSFIAILALCSSLKFDIITRDPDVDTEYKRMSAFFDQAISILNGDKRTYTQHYIFACKVWMDEVMPASSSDKEVRNYMAQKTKRAEFQGLIRSISKEIDTFNLMKSEED